MSVPHDGSRIHTIVFVSPDRQPAKRPKSAKGGKQWVCPPSCGRRIGADDLIDFEHGWSMEDAGGRWWVKGICPHCWRRVQVTKTGIGVVEGDHQPGREWKPVRKTIVRKRGEPR